MKVKNKNKKTRTTNIVDTNPTIAIATLNPMVQTHQLKDRD